MSISQNPGANKSIWTCVHLELYVFCDNADKKNYVYLRKQGLMALIRATGAGSYGSLGINNASLQKTSQPARGNSKLMAAGSPSALGSLAKSQTQIFIANGKKIAQGASGASRISIRV